MREVQIIVSSETASNNSFDSQSSAHSVIPYFISLCSSLSNDMVRKISRNICEIGHQASLPIFVLNLTCKSELLILPYLLLLQYSDFPLISLALSCYPMAAAFLLSTLRMLVLLGIELLVVFCFYYSVLLEPFYC